MAIAHIDIKTNQLVDLQSAEVVHSLRGRTYSKEKGSTAAVNSTLGPSEDRLPISTSTISIAQLIEFVNTTMQSILSEDVLEHLGAQRNENGLYYGKVLHSKKANSQTSGKPSASPSEVSQLTAMQKQTVANYARTKVYTKADSKPLVP